MIFQADITIPKNTSKESPKDVRMLIAKGIITEFSVLIPAGHSSLAHLVIYHGGHPIAPSTENMDIHGDGMLLDWVEYYEFYQPPYELKLIGWNTDDTYPHTFTVYCVILPRRAILALAVVDAIKGAFGVLSPTRISIPTWLGGKKE